MYNLNPASRQIFLDGEVAKQLTKIEIITEGGIIRLRIDPLKTPIDIRELPSGPYILKLTGKTGLEQRHRILLAK